jgi:ActD protein
MRDPGRSRASRVRGILAIFDERDGVLAAVRRAKADGLLRLIAYAPAYDSELVDAASPPPGIGIGPFAVAAGAFGLIAGLTATIWTTLQWPLLMVGGKPLIAMPPFLVIAWVTLILFAAIATAGMLVLLAIGARPRPGAPYDLRLSDGSFGLWIECPPSRMPAVTDTMRQLGAVECHLV